MVGTTKPQVREITIVNISPQHCRTLEKLQRIVFYTLTEEEIITEEKYLRQIEVFPDGQLVALAHVDGKLVPAGATSSFRVTLEFANKPHTFLEAIDNGWFGNHNPDGDWLYGADISVLPEFRGMGIASKLYHTRRALVRKLNLRGEIAGGLIPGYEHYRNQMTVNEYVKRVKKGEIFDPTLSVQIKNGFVPHKVMHNHITDPRADNCAVLIIRPNPHYLDRRH